MNTHEVCRPGWMLLLVLLLAGCGGGIYSGTLIFEGQHQFGADTRLPGDVALRAGTAEFAAGSRIDGAIYVVGGRLQFNGETGGDLVVFDGNVFLGPDSVIGGDLRLGGGSLVQAETSVVRGETISGALSLPATGDTQPVNAADVIRSLLNALLLAGLGGLWARRWPQLPQRIHQAASQSWPAALALGLLALLALPILLVMMAFTIILIPLVFLLGALILVTVGMGIVTLGMAVAQRAAAQAGRSLSPGWAAFAGTLLLMLLFQLPLLGQVLFPGTAVFLFGAVLLTRFGTRAYRPPATVTGHEALSSYTRPERS